MTAFANTADHRTEEGISIVTINSPPVNALSRGDGDETP
jgi:hypothetical protein